MKDKSRNLMKKMEEEKDAGEKRWTTGFMSKMTSATNSRFEWPLAFVDLVSSEAFSHTKITIRWAELSQSVIQNRPRPSF